MDEGERPRASRDRLIRMSHPLDTSSRTNDITDAITALMWRGGIGSITMRSIAAHVGISVGTLAGHLENRQRIIRVCASNFGRRHLDTLGQRVASRGLDAFLPAVESDVVMTRAWLGWCELARSNPDLAPRIGDVEAKERHLLLAALVPGIPHDERHFWRLQAAGMICSSHEQGMTLERAREVLAGVARSLTGQAETAASALARSSATILSGSSAE